MTTAPDASALPADLQLDPQAIADALAELDRLLAIADRVEDRLRELEDKVVRLQGE